MARLRIDIPTASPDLMVVEYEQLKEEQRQRIASRDNLIYATLVAVGAVGAAALQSSSLMLLVLPPVCVILGWTHADNDRKVWELGRYVRHHLATRLPTGTVAPFGWEAVHRTGTGYRRRRIAQVAVTLVTVCGPGFVAVCANMPGASASPAVAILVLAEAAALVTLGSTVLTNSDRSIDADAHGRG